MIRPATNASLVAVLEAGIGLDMFGILSAYMLEDGRYAVMHLIAPAAAPPIQEAVEYETIFASADEAVAVFLMLKRKHQIGFEYEIEPTPPASA